MKKEHEIDRIFREGIGNAEISGRDAAWSRLDMALDEDRRRRRLPLLWTAMAIILTGSSGIGLWVFNHYQPSPPPAHQVSILKQTSTQPLLMSVASSNNVTAPTAKPSSAVLPDVALPSADKLTAVSRTTSMGGQKTRLLSDAGQVETINPAALADDVPNEGRFIERLSPLQFMDTKPEHSIVVAGLASHQPNIDSIKGTASKNSAKSKWSVDLVAGSDVFRLNKQLGYYGGVRLSRHLDKNTLISAGISYSSDTVNEQYRLSNKPAQQTEADAQLNHITTLRFPVYFQRQLPRSKWGLMVGLVPTYILNANVYNVPNSFTGDPAQYRQFTINDINRLNILFGAGIQYQASKRLSFELSGSYGFTGLVKDSYINQSRVNDNFRNIQAGLVYRLH